MIANFYFHFVTAYAISRHCGVDISKMSFLGSIPLTRTPEKNRLSECDQTKN
jgi:hypothetical protein